MTSYRRTWFIAGQGAIGSFCAANLERLDGNYQPISRSDGTAKRFVWGEQTVSLKAPVRLEHLSEIQNLLVPLKAYDVIPFLTRVIPHLARRANVVLCHNGMGTLEAAADLLPQSCALYFCTTSNGAYKKGQDIVLAGQGETYWNRIDTAQPSSVHANPPPLTNSDFQALFGQAKRKAELNELLWRKLLINCVINPLTAIHNIKNGELIEEKFQPTICALMQEFLAVAATQGWILRIDQAQQVVRQVIIATGANTSSMLQDVRASRQTEIDYINGYVADLAQNLAISCPVNLALVNEVKNLCQQQPVDS